MRKLLEKYWLSIVFIIIFIIVVSLIGNKEPSLDSFTEKLNSMIPERDSDFSLSDTIIDLSSLIDPSIDKTLTQNRLNMMSRELRAAIDNNADPEIISKALNEYFFRRKGYTFDFDANKYFSGSGENISISRQELINFHSISRVIERRRGICLSMSLLFLIMAEKLDLPMYGVLVPGHIYVRYKEKGKAGVNIETTYNGVEIYDYEQFSNIEFLDKSKMIYGKEVGNYVVVGAFLNNLGFVFHSLGKRGKAEILYKKAIEMVPDFSEPYNNLAVLFEEKGSQGQAVEEYEQALKINPNMAIALSNLGRIYYEKQRYIKAEQYLERAVRANSNDERSREFLKKIKGGVK